MKKLLRGISLSLCLCYVFQGNLIAQSNSCSGATTLLGCETGRTIVGSTADAYAACSGTVRYDVWYKFTAASTNPIISLSNIGTNFSNQTPRLQLFSGVTCGGMTSITCGGTSITASGLTIGNNYYIRVYSITTNAIPTSAGGFDICLTNPAPFTGSRTNEVFMLTTLSGTNLIDDPWDINYGPDNFLWITEAKGYRVFRMDPNTGARTTILDLSNSASGYLSASEHTTYNRTFNIATNNPQGGLAGLALHPDWATKKYVYISYVHNYNSTAANSAGVFYTNSIVRFTYNPSTDKLESPLTICDTLPGSSDHNSQRMTIAPVGGINYLFYAAGDMGAGQFGNARRPIKAQVTGAYEGKILRFNLEQDTDSDPSDKWIPDDNPFNGAKESAVWCTGIRNNQGFAFANGKLYGSSHGPYSDDEINVLESAKNYGHPLVIGYSADGNYNGSKAGNDNGSDVTIMPLINNEVTAAAAITNYKDPLFSGYPSDQPTVNGIWSNPVNNGAWPSEGWSGMDIYNHTLIPGWKNSLMLGSLKWGRVLRFKLNAAGDTVKKIEGFDTLSFFGSKNRFRDVAVGTNGKDIYIIMDKSETTSGPSAGNPRVSACNGCVQKYTFLGYNDASGKSSISRKIPAAAGTANSCVSGTTVTIDASNSNLWVPITGPDGNILAEIFTNGQTLGTVQSSFYTTSSVRTVGGRKFPGRNIYIDPATAPASPVKIRLYLDSLEYAALRTAGGSSVITDMRVLQNTDVCRAFPITAATVHVPAFAEKLDTSVYMLQANSVTLGAASSFYFANGNFILPIELITFNGNLQDNGTALLKWVTENEVNTDFFVVERSIDGVNFSGIKNVGAAGNSTGRRGYSVVDGEIGFLNAKTIYYRLKQVDRNLAQRYTNTVAINLADRNSIVSITPNPANHVTQLRVKAPTDGNAQWKLYDGNGLCVSLGQMKVVKDVAISITIPIDHLARGTYYMHVTGVDLNESIKLQKK